MDFDTRERRIIFVLTYALCTLVVMVLLALTVYKEMIELNTVCTPSALKE